MPSVAMQMRDSARPSLWVSKKEQDVVPTWGGDPAQEQSSHTVTGKEGRGCRCGCNTEGRREGEAWRGFPLPASIFLMKQEVR